MTIEKKFIPVVITAVLAFSIPPVYSQTTPDPFDELENEIAKLESEGSEEDLAAYIEWRDQYLANYQKFREEHFGRLDDIRDQLINTWGESDISSATEVVVYSEDETTKTIIDLEKNEVRVSVLHDSKQPVTPDIIFDELNSLMNDDVKPLAFVEQLNIESTEPLVTQAVVSERSIPIVSNMTALIEKEKQKIEAQALAQAREVEKIADITVIETDQPIQEVEEAKLEEKVRTELVQINKERQQRIDKLLESTKNAVNNDVKEALKDKKITTYTMPLKQSNYIKKAERFQSYIYQYSEKWNISQSLLFAIMHTESHFNPSAQSHIPAFGLMQIVPQSAGLDVNRFLYKKDELMTKDYLFTPQKNIETGVAYVHILNSRYLSSITDPASRRYCIIAAYNTGAGNVAKTFNNDGSRNIRKAAKIINSMTPEEVRQQLLNNLPYDETRKYLTKVLDRQTIYKPMDTGSNRI